MHCVHCILSITEGEPWGFGTLPIVLYIVPNTASTKMVEYYDVLGVKQDATTTDIKKGVSMTSVQSGDPTGPKEIDFKMADKVNLNLTNHNIQKWLN